MVIDDFFIAVILIAGLIVGFAGINIYRYAVIAMSGAGGYMLGSIVCKNFLNGMVGEGIFRESNTSSVDSFVIAVFVLAGIGLAFAFYNIMGAVTAGIGSAFIFARIAQVFMGLDVMTMMVAACIGAIIGATLGYLAVKANGWPMIIFTALCGARMASYTGALYLRKTAIASTIAKPVIGYVQSTFPDQALRVSLSIELFIVLTILGIVVQSFLRDD